MASLLRSLKKLSLGMALDTEICLSKGQRLLNKKGEGPLNLIF